MNSPPIWVILVLALAGQNGFTKAWAATSPETHFAQYATNRVHYLVSGSGPETIVFIHGWGGSAGVWREQLPALTNRARIILIDLSGHGESDKPKLDYTMDYLAGGVVAVLNDARADKATLVGHSMGTPVMCGVYRLAPEKVAALVAVDGALRRPKGAAEEMEKFIAPYRTPEYRQHVTNFVNAMFPNPGTERIRDSVRAQVLDTPQYVLSSSMDSMFKGNQPDWDLQKVKIPVLVINAKNPMWTSEYEQYVRDLSPQTEYRIIEGTGHWLMLEKPSEFNSVLVEILRKQKLIRSSS